MDYKLASATTCTGNVSSCSTCSVAVTFAPLAPGQRNGAVVLQDASGNTIATNYLYGVGTGPAIAFPAPPKEMTYGNTLSYGAKASNMVTDPLGNLYAADSFNRDVYEALAAGGYSTIIELDPSELGGINFFPSGVAVDGAGNVFFTDAGIDAAVKEIPAVGGGIKIVASGFNSPTDIAMDGSGNLFVSDSPDKVYELLAANRYSTKTSLGGGFNFPHSIAVDANENVFLSDTNNSVVDEILAASGYTTVKSLGSGFSYPDGVRLDSSGNVYVADAGNQAVKEILATGGYTTVHTLYSHATDPNLSPSALALDPAGDIFVNDYYSAYLYPRSQIPSALNFLKTPIGTVSPDSPQTLQIINIGNATLDAVGTGLTLSPNWHLVEESGTTPPCTESISLAAGATCNINVDFEPTETGIVSGSLTISDNALNNNPATQVIPLAGGFVAGAKSFVTVKSLAFGTIAYGESTTLQITGHEYWYRPPGTGGKYHWPELHG